MRIQLLTLALLGLFNFHNPVAAQTYLWNRTIESEGFDEAYDLVTDNLGNVYVAGMIEYLADFGNGVHLESMGVHDIFIAKYDGAGNLIWAINAGGKDGDKVQSITLDGLGNIYVAGEFEDTSYWGPIMKVAEGGNNMFVARYDTSGNVQWVRSLGTVNPSHTRGYGVTCDVHGNVYVAGGTLGDTYYDGNFLFTSAGDYDGLVISFDPNGTFRWATRMGGGDSDKARGVVSDMGSNIYVTGYYSGNADFSGTSLPGHGHTDIFIAKYDTSGLLQWVTQAGDTGFERADDIDYNVNGQILITGYQSRGKFDSRYASCQGMTDAFIAGYDAAGNNLWVTAGGGPEDDEANGVTHDSAGNVYMIGDYGGSATFPPYTFTGNHYAEPFIASYTPDGSTLRWVRNGTGPSNDRGTSVGIDPQGNIFACGNFDQTLTLGSMVLPGDSLLDIFVTKLSPQNSCASSASVSGNIVCAGMCNGTATVTSSGQAPYTYSWNTTPVQQTQTATGLCAGNYTVTVTDLFGCTSSANITLIDPQPLSASAFTTDISCYGACDGTAGVSATGESPFSYSWDTNPVQTSDVISGLCGGVYTVTVTDANGCSTSSPVSLADPAQIVISSSTTPITCYNSCDGVAVASATGNGPFSYSWNTVPVQNTGTASALCDGNYTVTVTDASGCTSTASVSLSNPQQIQISPSVNSVVCHGECNGTAEAIVTGNGPFTYSWSTVPVQTSETATGLCAGSYTVVVTDAGGCTSSQGMLVTEPLAITLSGTITNETCTGCNDGDINVSSGGGIGNLQYSWSNGETTEDLHNLTAGTYVLCISDNNQCQVCDTFEVLNYATGISSPDEILVSIYPNPVSSTTTITWENKAGNKAELNLFNSIGELLLKQTISESFILNMESYADGMYFLHLESNEARTVVPLIVNHRKE